MSAPASNPSAKVRRPPFGARLGFWLALAVMLILTGLAFVVLETNTGTAGKVRALLRGVRAEERQSASTSRFGGLENVVRSLLDRATGGRQWQGDYYYQEQLTKLGTNAVPELLLALAKDSSPAARKISARALGELPAPGVLAGLTNALARDAQSAVREAAANALASLGNTNGIHALMTAMRSDGDGEVRSQSVSALGRLGGPAEVPGIIAAGQQETNDQVRAQMAVVLGELPDARSVSLLIQWLQTRGPTNQDAGETVYRSRYYSGTSPLDRYGLVASAARALGHVGGEPALQALMARWNGETNSQILSAVAEAFGDIGDARALPLLVAELKREEAEQRASIIEAIGNLGDTNAVAELLPLLNESQKEVRAKAASALGMIGSRAGMNELLRVAAEDSEIDVRVQACVALGMIGDARAQEVLLEAIPQLGNNRAEAVWALGHVGDSNAIPVLNGLLDDASRETRFAAAYALAEIGGPEAAETLAAKLADNDDYAKNGKACALALLGRTEGLTTICDGVGGKLDWQKFGALLAFIRIGGTAMTNNFSFQQPGHPVQTNVWDVLRDGAPVALTVAANEAQAGRGVAAVAGLLHDRNQGWRHYSARGLVFFHDPSTLPALREAMRDSNAEVRQAARVTARCIERRTGKSD